MYNPPHFTETRSVELHRLIAEHPLGALVMNGPRGLDADHLPFEMDPAEGQGRLLAHCARANPLWQQVVAGADVLVIFRGTDAYVSPNWYPSKHEAHRQVPTWNYQVVHVHGRIAIRDDERFVRGVVARLTRTHESRTGDARPWTLSDSAPGHIDALLKAIVGIEIEITRIEGKFKLSQNKEPRDRDTLAAELDKQSLHALAAAVRRANGGK